MSLARKRWTVDVGAESVTGMAAAWPRLALVMGLRGIRRPRPIRPAADQDASRNERWLLGEPAGAADSWGAVELGTRLGEEASRAALQRGLARLVHRVERDPLTQTRLIRGGGGGGGARR